jgi:hypothetical protein
MGWVVEETWVTWERAAALRSGTAARSKASRTSKDQRFIIDLLETFSESLH